MRFRNTAEGGMAFYKLLKVPWVVKELSCSAANYDYLVAVNDFWDQGFVGYYILQVFL